MDYVVGSVAALLSGNVTPNRPKLIRRALTPTKHQPSPNVTPKSELVDDRSIFLSPTLQKKKAIVKKSPKRIFQNPDLDITEDCEGNSILTSPKADKVKKHLKDDLECDDMAKKKSISQSSLSESLNKSVDNASPKKKGKKVVESVGAENTPKNNKKRTSETNVVEKENESLIKNEEAQDESVNLSKSPKKAKKRRKLIADVNNVEDQETNTQASPKQTKSNDDQIETKIKQNDKKKNKKRKKNKTEQKQKSVDTDTNLEEVEMPKKKKKGKKNKLKDTKEINTEKMEVENESESDNERSNIANPNAITEQDTDSEHDSDNEIESENEQEDNNVPKDEPSSDEAEEPSKKNVKPDKEKKEELSEEEVKRTLFVGNVPFSSKCKKEIKKIFSQYGQIETVRIRTIPVKDARVTPKLAVIKNELHPERSTVNVYVKYADEQSVTKALSANNTVLSNHHLRVSRSISTGAEHDPKLAIFVGNLPFAIEDETLRAKFEGCGEIESVRVVRDKKTNAGKGFGYVNFATKDGVELALAMTEEDLTIKNRILRVNRCTQSGSKGLKKPTNQKFGGKFGRGNQNRPQRDGRSQGKAQRWNQDRGNQERGNQQRGNRFKGNQDRGNQFKGNQDRGNQFKANQRNQDGKSWGQKEETGAARRLMNKRKQQDDGEGPSNKKQNISREKKPKKEFVGMTAEKKKKQKFNKDAKKKKSLSEILTKKQ